MGQEEKGTNARPGLTSYLDSLDSYDTVGLVFPNWWGDMPKAICSFLDEYDLSGKTIVSFITSGGSGFSGTIRVIENTEPNAIVLERLSLCDRFPQAKGLAPLRGTEAIKIQKTRRIALFFSNRT